MACECSLLWRRPFKAAGVPEDAALEVACSFGYPELTAVQLTSAAHADDVSAAAWDPTVGGLPADLTNDLSQQVLPQYSSCIAPAHNLHNTRSGSNWKRQWVQTNSNNLHLRALSILSS